MKFLLVLILLFIGCGENKKNKQNSYLSYTISVGEEYNKTIPTHIKNPTFKIISKPIEGMTINPKTGIIYWTPTPNQTGIKHIKIEIKNQEKKEIINLTINVKDNGFKMPTNSYFFSPFGNDENGTGKYNNPFYSPEKLCKNSPTLEDVTFYYRGGVYYNRGFETNNPKPYFAFKCNGTKNHMIYIKPWGNEKVKFKFDSNYGLAIRGNYIDIKDFEIEGMNQKITYEDAIKHWWIDKSYYNGSGIQISGIGNIVHNLIIHDTPGAGITIKKNSVTEDLTIKDNIIFNSCWWNVKGTSAIVLADFNHSENNYGNIRIENNLVFASESRIFSRVFSKGFANLTIDEGSSLLIKNSKNIEFLVNNNFFLFNGKGVTIRSDKVSLENNTLYNNGTTIKGKSAGFKLKNVKDINLTNNIAYTNLHVFESNKIMDVIEISNSKIKRCENNAFYGNNESKKKCDETKNIFKSSDEIPFKDVKNLDFSTNLDIGASQELLEKFKTKLKNLGFKIKKADFKLEIDGKKYPVKSKKYYEKQTKDIIKYVKELKSFKSLEGPDYFDFKGKSIYGYKIEFKDTNITGYKTFYLIIPQN